MGLPNPQMLQAAGVQPQVQMRAGLGAGAMPSQGGLGTTQQMGSTLAPNVQAAMQGVMRRADGGRATTKAAGIMFCDPTGRVLFLRRKESDHKGEWAFPGGKIEKGESAEEAARRETDEETGHEYDGTLKLCTERTGNGVHFTTYEAHGDSFKPRLNEEHDRFVWLEPAKALKDLTLHPGVRWTLMQERPVRATGGHVKRPHLKFHSGPIHSHVAGRTDHLPMHVESGSYVIPADIISSMGEGNTIAGYKHMRRVFGGGPYGQGSGPYGQSGGPYGEPLSRATGGEVEDYRGLHGAPDRDSGSPAHDLTNTYPEDVYGPHSAQYYGHYGSNHPLDMQSVNTIKSLRGKPHAPVSIYRAVPNMLTDHQKADKLEHQQRLVLKNGKAPVDSGFTDSNKWYDWAHKEKNRLRQSPATTAKPIDINPGDWVTINRQYAKEHGESTLNGDYKILSKKVPASDIYTNGDSIHEWGYDPKSVPRAHGGSTDGVPIVAAGGEYVLTPNQVKFAGDGDLERGHRVLDEFIKRIRAETVKTLKNLPGPAKN